MSLTRQSFPDLIAAREAIRGRLASAGELLADNIAAANSANCAAAFVRRFDAQALAVAAAIDPARPVPPLAGLAVSVKDLFDVAGAPATAASAAMADVPAAAHDATAVARLRAAGAALIAHTNLSEFAFSGVGINPHHGTPINVASAAIDPTTPRAPGGSTSGGATSVAAGAAWAALGSDTGGSIRIPAALQGLVGFKNTQRLTPLDGCIPLSPSLDTVCAITRSVRDAVLLHELLSARPVSLVRKPARLLRLALPITLMLDELEPPVASAFSAAVQALRRAGATVEEIDLPALSRLAAINAQGGFAAAESWAWHRQRLSVHGERYDPRVAQRIRRGEAMSAADYIDLMAARRAWVAEVGASLAPYDAALSPTVPMVAPPLAPLLASDEAFFAANAKLLRNPSAVNFFDGCAISLPCHEPGRLPVGLMLWAGALADEAVLAVALEIEDVLRVQRK